MRIGEFGMKKNIGLKGATKMNLAFAKVCDVPLIGTNVTYNSSERVYQVVKSG